MAGRVFAQGDAVEDFPGVAARLVGGDRAVARDDDPPVGGRAAAVAGSVVDEVRPQAGGLNTDAESGELVVPRGVGFFLGFQGPRRCVR